MPKFLKYTLISCASFLLLIVIAIISLVTLVNPNNYKPLITNLFHQATNREIKLDGDINWKLFPGIGLHLNKILITNPNQFEATATNFLSINKLDISVELLPLLYHKTVINELTVNGMNLNLLQTQTSNNWSITANKNTTTTSTNSPNKSSSNMTIEFNNINLLNSTISYYNLDTHKNYKINPFSLSLSSGFTSKLLFDLTEKKIKIKDVDFALNKNLLGQLNFNLDSFTQPQLNGNFNLHLANMNELLELVNYPSFKHYQQLLTNLNLSTKFYADKQQLVIQDFLLNLNDLVKINSTKLKLTNYTNANVAGAININATNDLFKAANVIIPTSLNSALFKQINLSCTLNGNKDLLNLDNIKLSFSGLVNLVAALKLRIHQDLNFKGNFKTNSFTLGSILSTNLLPPNKASNTLSLSANFNGSQHSLYLSSIYNKLDTTSIIGSFGIKSFQPLKFEHDLSLDHINLSNFVTTNGYKIILTNLHTSGNSTIYDNNHFLNKIATTQNLQIQNVTVYGLDINNIINQLNLTLNDINKTFNGSLSGLSNSPNIISSIKKIQNTFQTLQSKQPKNLNYVTNLGSLTANLVASNGISTTATYKLTGPVITSTGHGDINLNDQSWNYLINSQIIQPQPNPIINRLNFIYKLKGKIIEAQGAIDWISLQQQLTAILLTKAKDDIKAYTQKQIHNTLEREIPQATDKIKHGISNFINGLFK